MIFLQHIFNDIPDVNGSLQRPTEKVQVSGHSHRPLNQNVVTRLCFNPGIAGPRRFNLPITVGFLHLHDDKIDSENSFP